MYEKGDDWKSHAKSLFIADQVRLLHDLHVCQYFSRNKVYNNQILTWEEIYLDIEHQESCSKNTNMMKCLNSHVLSEFAWEKFVFDPTINQLWVQQFELSQTMIVFKPTSWLKCVRFFLLELSFRLDTLVKRIKQWQEDHPLPKNVDANDSAVKSRRYDEMINLESLCMEEKLIIQKSLRLVPAFDLTEEATLSIWRNELEEHIDDKIEDPSILKEPKLVLSQRSFRVNRSH